MGGSFCCEVYPKLGRVSQFNVKDPLSQPSGETYGPFRPSNHAPDRMALVTARYRGGGLHRCQGRCRERFHLALGPPVGPSNAGHEPRDALVVGGVWLAGGGVGHVQGRFLQAQGAHRQPFLCQFGHEAATETGNTGKTGTWSPASIRASNRFHACR